jgi:hypothetical protein
MFKKLLNDKILYFGGKVVFNTQRVGVEKLLIQFTPLGILNAQSATPLSFITADEVGVLNVQRCKISRREIANCIRCFLNRTLWVMFKKLLNDKIFIFWR